MKKVLLIGDSIRQGYDAYVRESMQNVAKVYYPNENCRFAEYVLRAFHQWTERLELNTLDAIHWNVGLWDTLRIYGDDLLTSPAVYREYIGRIMKRMRFMFPEAKIIFATSTPVLEEGFIPEYEMRYNKDVEHFNAIASEEVIKHGGTVNDLYALLKEAPPSFHSDQTHFYTREATKLLGERVTAVLCDALGLTNEKLVTPDVSNFRLEKGKNDTELYVKNGNTYVQVLGR